MSQDCIINETDSFGTFDLTEPQVSLFALPPIIFTQVGVSSLNSLSGSLYITGLGNISVAQSGHTITVSGADFTGNYLTQADADARYYPLNSNPSGFAYTGEVKSQIISLSGYIDLVSGYLSLQINSGALNLEQTGQNLQLQTNQNYNALSGYIINVSGNLQFNINTLDARLQATGSALYTLLTGIPTPSGFITTGEADLRYYSVSNPSGYITGFNSGLYVEKSETGKFYPNSNPSGFSTFDQLSSTGNALKISINALSGHVSSISGGLQSNINSLNTRLESTGSILYTLLTGIPTPSGFITTGNADLRYYSINNPSGYITGFNSGQFYLASNPNLYATSGNLTQTGSILIAQNLATSGALQTQLNSLSGFTTGISGVLQSQINILPTAANLESTGSNLFRLITGLSGQSVNDYATKLSLTQTGINIYSSINSLSGFVTGSSGSLQTQINTLASSVNLASTGQQAWSAAQNNAVNLSGNLTQTGQALGNSINSLSGFTTGISGYLKGLIQGSAGAVNSLNGQSGVLDIVGAGNISVSSGLNTIIISGNTGAYANFATLASLQNTGSSLYVMLTGLSGQANINFATAANLQSTGQQIGTSLSGASGVLFNLIGATGNILYIQLTGLSGQNSTDYATKTSLTQSGINLLVSINSLSGFTTGASGGLQSQISNLATVANLYTTGSSLYNLLTGFSGQADNNYATKTALTQTGIFLGGQINSLSGFTTGMSGALAALIQGSAGGVSSINGRSGILSIVGTGNISVTTVANTILISGDTGAYANFATNALLNTTGSNLYILLTGLSGQNFADYATKISLTQSGINLGGQINSLSGFTTGISGVLQTQINGLPTLLNLETTGSNLYRLITGASGQSVNDYALKTSLTQTGITLGNQINLLSGYTTGVSGGLQLQLNGFATITNLDVTGRNLFSIITGFSGQSNTDYALKTSLTQSGINLGVQINSLSGFTTGSSGGLQIQINSALTSIGNTGSNLYILLTGLSGQNVNDFASKTSLTQTGINIFLAINSLSGFTTGLSGGLEARIALTGQQSWNAANNNSINLSGNLTQSGIALIARDLAISGALQAQIGAGGTQVKVTGSTSISVADFTGIGTTLVFSSGGQIFISGAAGGGGGDVTQAQLNSLSGWTATNLTQTGSTLFARDLAISGALQAQISMGGGGSTGNSQFTSKIIDIPTGVSGLDVVFDINFSSIPIVVGNILFTGDFVISNISYINTTGFGLDFTDTIYQSGYKYNYLALSGNLFNAFPMVTQGTLTGTTPNIIFTNAEQQLDWNLIGNSTVTATGYATGRSVQLFISGDAVTRTFSWPAWTWMGGAPASSTANKKMRISLESRGFVAGNVYATYAEET